MDIILNEIEEYFMDIALKLNHELGVEVQNDLSENQRLLLFLVNNKHIQHVKDLAYFMNVSPSAISQMVKRMEDMDLIVREVDKNNRRTTILKIGPKGKEFLNQMEEQRRIITVRYLSKMNEEDLIDVRNFMKKFHDIIVDTQEGETP